MHKQIPTHSSHYELVANTFSVIEVAQPIKLVVCPDAPLLSVWEGSMELDPKEDWCCLVRDHKHIHGYLDFETPLWDHLDEHEGETAGDEAIPIKPEMMVPASLPLLDLVDLFRHHQLFFFVLTANDITHVVSFYDLDKLPMKLSLFALFMELESEIIELIFSDRSKIESCLRCLTEQRLTKARNLCSIKYKRETPENLLLCTTFIDKKEILCKTPEYSGKLPLGGRRERDKFFGLVETVRNQIAHSDSMLGALSTPANLSAFISDLKRTIAGVSGSGDQPFSG